MMVKINQTVIIQQTQDNLLLLRLKTAKVFHLVINHDEENENVMLLTEVSEDDLLNMVEKKEVPKKDVVKRRVC